MTEPTKPWWKGTRPVWQQVLGGLALALVIVAVMQTCTGGESDRDEPPAAKAPPLPEQRVELLKIIGQDRATVRQVLGPPTNDPEPGFPMDIWEIDADTSITAEYTGNRAWRVGLNAPAAASRGDEVMRWFGAVLDGSKLRQAPYLDALVDSFVVDYVELVPDAGF